MFFKGRKNSSQSKSFTIIELLVVIAIIAILASIILISLSSVRNRAKDSKTISQLSQIPSKVAIDYYTTGEYDICETSSSFKESSGLKTIENEIEERNGTITCYSEGTNYCISTQLLQGDYYCIKNNQKGRYSTGCTSITEGCENILGEEEEEEEEPVCGNGILEEGEICDSLLTNECPFTPGYYRDGYVTTMFGAGCNSTCNSFVGNECYVGND